MNKKVANEEAKLCRKRAAVVNFLFCHIFSTFSSASAVKLFTNHEEFFMIRDSVSSNFCYRYRCVAHLIPKDLPENQEKDEKLTARLCEKSICDSNPIRMSFIGICVFIFDPIPLLVFTLLHNNKRISLSNFSSVLRALIAKNKTLEHSTLISSHHTR